VYEEGEICVMLVDLREMEGEEKGKQVKKVLMMCPQ